jgi:hydroxypyruvate reductase
LRVHEAGHPIPDERGVKATNLAISSLNRLDEDVVVLALVSGGGSALLEAPRDGVTLADLARTTDLLLRAGAPIEALNAVRAPLSRVKSGGLRAAAPKCTWVTLILSDVLGNDPRVIASGPTVPGRRDPRMAIEVIGRYGVEQQVPGSVLAVLETCSVEPESQRTDDVLLVIGDNAAAVEAVARKAGALGLECRVVWRSTQGEAAELGREFVAIVSDMPESVDVVLGGGEATVTVRGDGRGGRNTEFALAAALELERRQISNWVIASLGTDGQDAMTGLAGAIADAGTARRARDVGVDPVRALARNDSLSVFEVSGGAVQTGPTGTNVNDVYIAVRAKKRPESASGRGN